MRKLTVLLIVASLVYIAFAVYLYFSYQNRIRETCLFLPEELRPYIEDFAPFSGSREGTLAIVVGALLGIVWVLHLSRHKMTVSDRDRERPTESDRDRPTACTHARVCTVGLGIEFLTNQLICARTGRFIKKS